MKRLNFLTFGFCLLLSMLHISSFAADVVADELDSVGWLAPEAFEKVSACMPSVSESAFKKMIQDSDNATTVMRPAVGAQANKSYLIVGRKQVICIKTSSHGKALLPVSAFENTVTFPGVPPQEAKKMWVDISQQLSKSGVATTLVVLGNGNAIQLSYLLAHDLPLQFYYADSFLKKGEYLDSDYKSVYRSLDESGSSIVARGNGEHVKYIGAK